MRAERIVLVALLLLSCTYETPTRPEVYQAASWQGHQRALWVLVRQPGYSASVNPGAVESYIVANSFGAASLEIDVVGWYSHPDPCGASTLEFVALADPDVDFALGYDFIVFGLIGSGCGGSIGGYGDYAPYQTNEGPVFINKRATVRGSHVTEPEVWTHEMLHGEGLSESYRYTCTGFPAGFPYSCSGQAYRDTYTVMSAPQYGGTFGHLVAADKERLGWIYPEIQGPGVYTLGRYETTGDALKVRRNAQSFYYIERRDRMQLRVGRSLVTDDLQSLSDPWSGVEFVVSGDQVTVTGVGGGDTTPPTGAMIYPADPLQGVVRLRIQTSDDLYMVQWREGTNRQRLDATEPPFSWTLDTRNYLNEPLTIRAKLIDPAGNAADLAVRVTIDNNPQVIDPIRGATLWNRTLTFQVVNPEAVAVEVEYQPRGGAFTRMGDWPVVMGRQSINLMLPKADVVVWVRGLDENGYQVGGVAKIRSNWDDLEDVW